MDRLLFLLKTLGYSQSEAITKMANDAKQKGLKGFSEASIRRGLTDESKKHTKPGPRKSNQMISSARENNQARLVVPEEPTIPPRPQVVREAEIVKSEPERPKKQTFSLNSKTLKGWPCERDYIYEIEVDEENRNVTRMYAISD